MNKTPLCECKDCKCDPCTCTNNNNCCTPSDICCDNKHGFWLGTITRTIIVMILIIGSYYAGSHSSIARYGKFGDGNMPNRTNMMQMNPVDNKNTNAMSEHCKMMPEMVGCKNNDTMTNTNISDGMMSMSMNDMVKMLEGKTGDELNRAFLEGMIPHHQAAVDMAKYLAASSKPELRKLGGEIITTQTKEIEQMKQWMKDWGYGTGSTSTGSMPAGMMMR